MSGPRKEPLVRVWLADIAHALRSLAGTPRYSLPAMLSLALGIAASTAVFAVFSAIVLRPLPFPHDDQLVRVYIRSSAPDDGTLGFSYIYYGELKDRTDIFSTLTGYRSHGVTIRTSGGVRHAIAAEVTPEFFDTLQPDVELGRTFTAAGPSPDPPAVAVVSHSFWLAALGGAPIQGTTLLVEGKPRTIVGVIADDRALPAGTDVWFTLDPTAADKNQRFRYGLDGVGRLAPGVNAARASEMLHAAGVAQNLRFPGGSLAYSDVASLRRLLVGDRSTSAVLMLVAVGAFLLLACANVASLMTTRASLRSRELAIRAALGADPPTLARQAGLESVLLTLAGGGTGLALAAGLISMVNRLLAGELQYTPVRLDANALVAFAAIAIGSSAIIGLAPVLHAMRTRPMETLRGEGRSTSSRASRRFRQVLVAVQIAITVVLLVGAMVLIRSVAHLEGVAPGIAQGAVGAHVIFPDARTSSVERKTAFARALVERVRHLPGVEAAAIASDVPFGGDPITLGLQMEPGAPNEHVVTRMRLAGPDYFKVLQIPVLSGRAFSASDSKPGVYHVIVNRAFAMQIVGTLAAVGHRVSTYSHAPATVRPDGSTVQGGLIWLDIVGVVADTLDTSLTGPAPPILYGDAEMPDAISLMDSGFTVVARGTSPDALVPAMATIAREVDGDSATYDVEKIGTLVARSYRQRSLLEQLLTAFALGAVLVAIIGLYGVTSYTVAERSAEIGVRRALGATRFAIIRLILTETAAVVGVGMAAGLAGSFAMRSLLASFLYGVDAVDPASYVLVCAGVAIIALLSALGPARAAGNVPPSHALSVG